MDRNLALEFVRVTEAAAIASARWMGLGQKDAADQAAVDSMRKALEHLDVRGTVVIGEGERDEAPMLYIGEKFGSGGANSAELDVALDPLEGTNLCANGHNNALSVIAVAEKGRFLHAPDTYMDKIAVGPECRGLLRYEMSIREKVEVVAKAKSKTLRETTVCILERDRHKKTIDELRSFGCRIMLIGDGDVSASIATCNPETGIDILLGSGGAPEGVISAAAMRCLGGDFIGKLLWRSEEEKSRAEKMGIQDFEKVYSMDELASGPVMFCATGVTEGSWLKGVKFFGGGCTTNSIVMRSSSGTIREVSTKHIFATKPASGALL
jgi:fructose-1,6-bisphosphatase class II